MTAVSPTPPPIADRRPSPSQLRAIEAPAGALLVLAGPGAGKTFCLIERIHYLIGHCGIKPDRICAFTFTNKAAGEIAQRLEARLGEQAGAITRSTIHAFCANLLRRHAGEVGLDPGFGIADEDYQENVLRRLRGPSKWHRTTLNRFSAHRFRGDPLRHEDVVLLDEYDRYLARRNVVDFDMLVIRAADLLDGSHVAGEVRSRWDVVLVDEFQDLNRIQYRVVKALAADHRHVFAVGDDEQSIYSWAGADPKVFTEFANDFGVSTRVHLEENHRCPQDVFALARQLVMSNTPIFLDRVVPHADRESVFTPRALSFATDDDEAGWIVNDVRCDRELTRHDWSEVALLYRKHDIGERLEAAFLNAGIPCRLPRGRALGDDPVIGFVIAALRVISSPGDVLHREGFFRAVLPSALYDEAAAKSLERRVDLQQQLIHMSAQLPRADDGARQIRRALIELRNLEATGRQHVSLSGLVQELLSKRVGPVRSALVDRHDEISDPASLPDVVALAAFLRDARSRGTRVWIPPLGGMEIPLRSLLRSIGIDAVRGVGPPGSPQITIASAQSVELPLAVFKAAQLVEIDVTASLLLDFTAIDLETTDRSTDAADIVEIAAVRVRNGRITDRFSTFVRPVAAVTADARKVHRITDEELAGAPSFAEVWPRFREFCGNDIIVAHNGYSFDFKVLARAVRSVGAGFDMCTFDTLPLARELIPTSRKLGDLARHFGVPLETAHRALDDTVALAHVVLALGRMKEARARKTALVSALDNVGVALALCDEAKLSAEARLFRMVSRVFALGRYSDCLEVYEREQAGDSSIPSVDEIIERLGGADLMIKLRAEKTAEERYPAAMTRLSRLIGEIPESALAEQVTGFLERVVLSQWDGVERENGSVNLLTLHSTKGLEFSRVYIVGAEDAQLPGGSRETSLHELEEARRLLYVGMTRTVDRLILTRAAVRAGKETGGHRFLDEMGLIPVAV